MKCVAHKNIRSAIGFSVLLACLCAASQTLTAHPASIIAPRVIPDALFGTEGNTPLHDAVMHNNLNTAREIITHYAAAVSAVNSREQTPLHAAAGLGAADMIGLLVNSGATVNAQDEYGETPLHYALRAGNKKAITVLLQCGADHIIPDHHGMTIIHWAAFRGYYALLKKMLDLGHAVNAAADNGMTPLHWAYFSGKKRIINLLIARGADENIRDNEEYLPRDYAAAD